MLILNLRILKGYLLLWSSKGQWCLNYWQASKDEEDRKITSTSGPELSKYPHGINGTFTMWLPTPVTIPKKWPIIVLHLKDRFHTKPFHLKDYKICAFSVHSCNLSEPMKIYHWNILPQRMTNNPT